MIKNYLTKLIYSIKVKAEDFMFEPIPTFSLVFSGVLFLCFCISLLTFVFGSGSWFLPVIFWVLIDQILMHDSFSSRFLKNSCKKLMESVKEYEDNLENK